MSPEGEPGPDPPSDPLLRDIAEQMERMGRVAEIVDDEWRFVYISSELCRVNGVEPKDAHRFYGLSWITREVEHPDVWGVEPESQRTWWRAFTPYMRSTLEPGTPAFTHVFGPVADAAARVVPKPMPSIWTTQTRFSSRLKLSYTPLQHLLAIRLQREDGSFAGVLQISWPGLPGSVTGLLSRGDVAMYERMARLAEPARRPAAILFVDLASSSLLARRLPTSRFFSLIRDLTTLIDEEVSDRAGIVGKHAGDGASAFFLASDAGSSESAAARAAISAAQAIRERARALGSDDTEVQINAGIHWGAKMVIGQVVTGGRLEVTALGDEVNETARVESAATQGAILVTKDVVERLTDLDAEGLGIDPAHVSYRLIGSDLPGSDKAVRDAGLLSVTQL